MGTESNPFGRGFASPMAVNVRGGIEAAQGLDKVRQSIHTILGTQRGERVMRPDFGANLRSLLYMPNNRATAALARFSVEDALKRWEPRILVDGVTVANDNPGGRLVITVRYRLRATSEPDELVYPVRLEQS